METLTMNIKREFFASIVAKKKPYECRERSYFWKQRIEPLSVPFKLRLLNGMTPPAPEAVVVVTHVTRYDGEYQLHLGSILSVRRWDARKKRPKR